MHIINNAKNHVCKWVFTAALGLVSISSQANFSCELAVASQWGSGGTATITITHSGDETVQWANVIAAFPEGISLPNSWGALASIIEPPNTYSFSPEPWNASLAPSGSASVGFQYSVTNNADIHQTVISGDCASSDNSPPVASFTIGGYESIVNLNASTSTDPDGDVLTYEWIIDDESRIVTTDAIFTSFLSKGSHVITLRVSDGALTSELSRDFNMPYPFDPYARFTIETDGLTALVDGSGSTSYDPVDYNYNIISSYAWDFGDGTTGSGATVSHTYDQAGTYTISLVVTDSRGDGSVTHDVSVSDTTTNNGFAANLSCENKNFSSYYANLDITINWDDVMCSTSVQNTDSERFTVSYDFGDGAGPSDPQTSNVVYGKNHRYQSDGIYTVSTSVDDGVNIATDFTTVSAVGNGIKPVVNIACSTSGLTATCDYTFDDTDGDVFGSRIIWSSVTEEYLDVTGSGTVSHTFSEAGSYNIGLYAWDEHYVSVDNQWVNVTSESTNTPPEVNLECESIPLFSDNFQLNILLTQQQTRCTANATDADGDTLTYAWDYGDGTTVTNANDSLMYMYQSGGPMTISVLVDDGTDSTLDTIEYSVISNGATPLAFLTCITSELTVSCDVVGQTEDGITPNMLIEWGDTTHESVSPGMVSHTYPEAGNYTVVLHAYDSIWDDTAKQTVEIEGERQQAPTHCEYIVVGDWGSQFQGNIVITNNSDEVVSGWQVVWEYGDGSIVTNLWNAGLSGSNPYNAANLDWNTSIQPGARVTFGFNGNNGGSTASVPTLSGPSCSGG